MLAVLEACTSVLGRPGKSQRRLDQGETILVNFSPSAAACPCPGGCRALTGERGTFRDGFWSRCDAANAGGLYR